jgi:SWI/SNF-related matrix-associated actin-dependent regulator 1 of chromatin subfamily A
MESAMNNFGLTWTAPKEVNTAYGPRLLRKASGDLSAFWDAWRADKDALKNQGYSVSKSPSGNWEVAHWGRLDQAEVAKREQTVEASRAHDADINVPCPQGRTYFPFQRAGIGYMLGRPATLLGDEMGTGKTIQIAGVINASPEVERILIVCPASIKINWAREFSRWLVTTRPIYIVNGKISPAAIARLALPANVQFIETPPVDGKGIFIINYDIVVKHIDFLRSFTWDLLACDEAHYLKNLDARRTQLVVGRRETRKQAAIPALKAKRRILATGTPIPNRPIELFPLVNFLDPQTWNNFFGFAKRYAAAHNSGWGWDFSGASNLAELQHKLRSTLMLRRLKKDVLTELPPKVRQVIELPLPAGANDAVKAELDAYESRAERLAALQAAVELAKATDDEEEHRAAVNALRAGYTALFSEMSRLRHETAVAKIPACIDFLRDAVEASGKVVCFAHHKDVVQAIREAFGSEAVVLVGDTPQQARDAAVQAFQNDPSIKLFIGSLTAAGVGITLTAASHVVFCELDWVPGNVRQAEDRCHRPGQDAESVLIQHLVLEGSLDATIAQRIIAKLDVIDRGLDIGGKPVYDAEPVFVTSEKEKAEAATADLKREAADKIAIAMTAEQRQTAHLAVQMLAGMCDGAWQLDDVGFNKIDTQIGHAFAARASLSPRQAVFAAKLARKYRRQLPETINTVIEGVFA